MKRNSSPFKWGHFEPSLILLCVRWYCKYQLSYRDLEEMMCERGLSVDHTTARRWVQKYAPEINKRMRPHLKMSGTSYRLDETSVSPPKITLPTPPSRLKLFLTTLPPVDAVALGVEGDGVDIRLKPRPVGEDK